MTIKQKLGAPVKFKKAKLPSSQPLIGQYTILEPFNLSRHSQDLYSNFSLDKKKAP